MVEKKRELTKDVSMTAAKKTPHKREIFKSGDYIQYFTPDDKRNPFHKIYKKKKQDTIEIISASGQTRTVLDVGGGMGRLALALAGSVQGKVVMADISRDMLRLVVKNSNGVNNIDLINADAHQLPFKDKSFECIAGLDLLCHLKEPDKAMREFHRVLSDKGMLILDSTNSNPLWTIFYPRYIGKNPLRWLRTIKFRGVLPGWEAIVKHYTKSMFFSLLQDAGFKVIREIDYGPVICPKWHLAVSRKIP
jgi:ubiquinone/menaquinone biosynthesis C-methylase UbiE